MIWLYGLCLSCRHLLGRGPAELILLCVVRSRSVASVVLHLVCLLEVAPAGARLLLGLHRVAVGGEPGKQFQDTVARPELANFANSHQHLAGREVLGIHCRCG